MAQYRIVFVETIGDEKPPETVECAEDLEAISKAVDLFDDRHVEIWDAGRLVIRPAPIARPVAG
jgi:hypothetical protein